MQRSRVWLPWRNRLARTAVNRKVGGSSPPGSAYFSPACRSLIDRISAWGGDQLMSALSVFGFLLAGAVLSRLVLLAIKLFFPIATNWSRLGAKKNSWAIVTGASDGIGREFATQLAEKGFNILLVGRDQEKLKAAADSVAKHNVKTEFLFVDFAKLSAENLEQLEAFVKSKEVSILVNNVGVSHEHPEFFVESSIDKIDEIINVNVLSTVKFAHVVIPELVRKKSGLVLNMGSFSGEFPTPLLQVYSGSKAFLKTWSLALAEEVSAHGVHVELLNTYYVATNMSKRKHATTMCPTAATFVQSALKCAGSSYFTTPYAPHAFAHLVLSLLPTFLLLKLNQGQLVRIRSLALAKKTKKY